MTWHDAIRRWLTWLAAGGARPETLRLRRYQLARAAHDLGGHPFTVDPDQLATWLAARTWSPETRRSQITALRSFYRWALVHELTANDPTSRLPRQHPTPGEPRPAPEPAIDAALRDASPRLWLMLALAARHGLRRGEIARVHSADVMPGTSGWSLVVHGKGGKDRTVPLLPDVAAPIRAAAGWVFPNSNGAHLTPGHVGVLIGRALPAGVTPHMLRHRFATVVYRRSLDIRNLQRLLGHASVATTQRYAAPDDDQLRRVLECAA